MQSERGRRLRIDPALIAVIGAAALVRLPTLGRQSLWEDEAVTRWLMHRGFGGLLSTLPHTEATPPLYYVLEWSFTRILGTSEIGLRSLSALAGLAAVLVVYAIGRTLASRRVALVAAVLVALSPDLVWYSQEARAYALFVLLVATSVLAFLRARARPDAQRLILWAAASAAALATHYFAVFIVLPEALLLIGGATSRRRAFVAAASVGVVGLGLLPLAIAQHHNGGTAYLADISLGERLREVPGEWIAGPPAPASWRPFLIAFAVPAAGALFLLWRRSGPREARAALLLAAFAGLAVVVPVLGDVAGLHFFAERNAMDVVPLLLVVLASGIGAERSGRGGIAALLAIGAVFVSVVALTVFDSGHQREDWRGVARALGPAHVPRALVIAPITDNPPPVPRIVGLASGYLPTVTTMPRGGASVREIDVIDIRAVEWFDGDTPAAGCPPAPAPGFRLVRSLARSNYRLFGFVSARPTWVTPSRLSERPLLPRSPDVMVGLQRGS